MSAARPGKGKPGRRRGQHGPRLREEDLFVFLDGLRCGLPSDVAAAAAGRTASAFRGRRQRDAAFRERWDRARAIADVRWGDFWDAMAAGGHTVRSAAVKVGLDGDWATEKCAQDAKFAARVRRLRGESYGDLASLLLTSAKKRAEEGDPRPLAEAIRMLYPDWLPDGGRK